MFCQVRWPIDRGVDVFGWNPRHSLGKELNPPEGNQKDRISIGWDIFALSGLMTIAITLITISFQSVKSALANPADSLRYE